MRGAITCLLTLVLGLAAAGARGQDPPAPSPQVPPLPQPGEIPLVDLMPGGSTAEWRQMPPLSERLRVFDGVLTLPTGAWLVHSRTYSDYVLNLEFQLLSESSRIGVLSRGWWEQGSAGVDADHGYEWWLRAGRNALFQLVIQEPHETVTIPSREREFYVAVRQPGEWQTLALMASADRFQVWLNGTMVTTASGGTARTGLVGLRSRGAVKVRGVGIRDLSAQPLFEQALEAGVHLAAPALVKDVKPRYVAGALRRKVEGAVVVECVVVEDGTVGAVRLLRSLDADLDIEALTAVRQWQFEPPRRDGVPVKVRFAITLDFTKKPK